MRGRELTLTAVGAGLMSMLLASGIRAEDQALEGVQNLQDFGKFLFKLADTNNDNRISQKEAVDAGNLLAGGFFFRADANGDGTLSPQEARAAREALFNQRPILRLIFQKGKAAIEEQGSASPVNQGKVTVMNLLDSNHDSNITAAEVRQAVQTGVQTLFMSADRSNDGQLDPAELNQAVLDLGRTAVQTAFNSADQDRNGAVSQAEFDKAIMNPAHVLFRILDANNDGQISADEMRSGMQVVMQELRSMQVPEPTNSISNQIERFQNNPQQTARPGGIVPRSATTAPPVQVTPGTAPTTVIPPRR